METKTKNILIPADNLTTRDWWNLITLKVTGKLTMARHI